MDNIASVRKPIGLSDAVQAIEEMCNNRAAYAHGVFVKGADKSVTGKASRDFLLTCLSIKHGACHCAGVANGLGC